jgi:ParB-like chromosome segregation protein Spo0J
LAELEILHQSPAALTPRSSNPRTHSEKQLRQIADSIRTFGFTNPILVDRDNGIVAGHGRVEAAKRLKLRSVPTIRLEDMTEAEIRAYVIADNRLAENAGWDRELLAIELQHLYELDLDFDVTITGFEMPEISATVATRQQRCQSIRACRARSCQPSPVWWRPPFTRSCCSP